jgi:secreted PhoX family phosphatase
MHKPFGAWEDSNRSANPSLWEVSDPARRHVLRLTMGGAAAALYGALGAGCSPPRAGPGTARHAELPRLGFTGVPPSRADALVVPPGYVAEVIAPWGEPVGIVGAMPAWRPDASNTAADQARQLGMHHDGLQYVPLDGSRRGLLVINHEYTDDGLLFTDGMAAWSAAKTAKSQAAHGISVVEVALDGGRWQLVRPSRHARRITADSPVVLSGPAAGHPLMRTAHDPEGRVVRGTLNNCASGLTPWGTVLVGEENFAFYFRGGDAHGADQRRWGLRSEGWYPWWTTDERFDAGRHPNEFHRFGWIVEIDPLDPASPPVKRTALGRAAHEGAWVAVTRDGRAVVYSGEDAAFESIYKFVSRDRIAAGGARANRTLLDHGTLYVARFDADGRGRWLPLVHGQGPLTPASGFADQGEVVVKARQASDLLGATRMDRPEWLAIDPRSGSVYCTLTNNRARGTEGRPGADAANPRAGNTMGHIVRWREGEDEGGDFDATAFRWEHFVLAGDPANERPEARGRIEGDFFGCPDGLAFDPRGLLWIQTDVHASQMHRGEFVRLGNNQMLACDVATGEVRRFLTGPVNAEVTGAAFTPDATTLFVDIQHPGEAPADRADPADPTRWSRWPDGERAQRPRSATVAIRRLDGGPIGS